MCLSPLRPAHEQQHRRRAILAKVEAVAGSEHHSGLLHAAPDALVVAQVPRLEANDARLHSGAGGAAQRVQPVLKGTLPSAVSYSRTVTAIVEASTKIS